MSALPHIGQTVRNRRDLRVLRGGEAYAAHQHYTDESLRWEMERAERTELLPTQPEPAMFCAIEHDHDEPPALFGMVDALRAEFGRAWPVYLTAYLILVALAVVLTLALTGVIA